MIPRVKKSFNLSIFQFCNRKGVAALPVMLFMGGLMVEIGLTSLFVIYYLSQGAYGAKLSGEALSAAQSGVEDALLKVVRDKNFSSVTPYALTVGARIATVTVCRDFKTVTSPCDTANAGRDEITSLGTALTKRRGLRAMVSVAPLTGEVQMESVTEISL